MAAPGISAEERKTLRVPSERMAKSPTWAETLKQKGSDADYLGGEASMKVEQLRIERAFRATGMLK